MEESPVFQKIREKVALIEELREELLVLADQAIEELEDLIPSDRLDDNDDFIFIDQDDEDFNEDDFDEDLEDNGATYQEMKDFREFVDEADFDMMLMV